MKWLLALMVISLQGCAYYSGQQVRNDPDCRFQSKPDDYRLPAKCGPKSYSSGGYVARPMPNNVWVITPR